MTDLTDQLDAIQARADEPFTTAANGIAQVDADRDFLLVLARKQQAAIDAVTKLAERWQADFPHKASLIREALEAKP